MLTVHAETPVEGGDAPDARGFALSQYAFAAAITPEDTGGATLPDAYGAVA